jgi:2-polyprenyl-6-methoxyphenol hydroxylase-like FAD-dependent oxidoreductase
MLTLLLARGGVPVTLIEGHKDFERDFRGDGVHPSTLEALDQIGLAERVLALPHAKMTEIWFRAPGQNVRLTSLRRLPSKFPFMAMMPQSRLLEVLVEEAKRYPHFTLLMGTHAQELIEESGVVRGVRVRGAAEGEVRATLTVAADGRFSRLRKAAGLEPIPTSEPMEVIWFRLPRHPEDRQHGVSMNVGRREVFVAFERPGEWQVGGSAPPGVHARWKAEGLGAFHDAVAAAVPWLGDRATAITDWSQTHLLSVQGSRLHVWWKPGLLFMGDAAHVMLPVGGVGTNAAVGDAVEAANVLAEPLRAGKVEDSHLAEVQRRREDATRRIQAFQARVASSLYRLMRTGKPVRMPLLVEIMLKIPALQTRQAQLIAFGLTRPWIEHPEERPAA